MFGLFKCFEEEFKKLVVVNVFDVMDDDLYIVLLDVIVEDIVIDVIEKGFDCVFVIDEDFKFIGIVI